MNFVRKLRLRRRSALALLIAACSSHDDPPEHSLRIALDTSKGIRSASVLVTGLSPSELSAWRGRAATAHEWPRAFKVSVAGMDSIAIAGRYVASDTALEFRPLFPLDVGRPYSVSVEPPQLARDRQDSTVRTQLVIPTRELGARARVSRVLPSGNVVPENLLRLYVEFTAPMSREPAAGFVHLLYDNGKEVPGAFLPVDGDFWNGDRTRYTLFLDPGRVKRGILPNEQMGRPMLSGRRYTLRIDSTWRDARGLPLAAAFAHTLRAGPAELEPVRLAQWRIEPPSANGTTRLVVRFPKALDHGLLRRALGVETASGASVDGRIEIEPGERAWRFVPTAAWKAGSHRLVVLSILEDIAGNRINRRFEADRFDRVDSSAATPRFEIPFVVR